MKNRSSFSAETRTHRSKTEQMRGGIDNFQIQLLLSTFSVLHLLYRLQCTTIFDLIKGHKIQDLQDITLVETNQTFSTVERNKFAVIIIE